MVMSLAVSSPPADFPSSGHHVPKPEDLPSRLSSPCSIAESERAFAVEPKITIVPDDLWDSSLAQRIIPAPTCLSVSFSRKVYSRLSQPGSSSTIVWPGKLLDRNTDENLEPDHEPPSRAAIGSSALLHEIATLAGLELERLSNVFLHPFKVFELHGEDFRHRSMEIEQQIRNMKAYTETSMTSDIDKSGSVIDDDTANQLSRAEKLRAEFKCLLSFIDNYLGENTPRSIFQIEGLDTIRFDQLWYFFQPGELLITNTPSRQAYIALHMCGGSRKLPPDDIQYTPLVVDCVSLDCDGNVLGPVFTSLSIRPYQGMRPFKSLGLYPVQLDEEKVRKELISRGQMYLELIRDRRKPWTYRGQAEALYASRAFGTAQGGSSSVSLSVWPSKRLTHFQFLEGDVTIDLAYNYHSGLSQVPDLDQDAKVVIANSRNAHTGFAIPRMEEVADSSLNLNLFDNFMAQAGNLLDKLPLYKIGQTSTSLKLCDLQFAIMPATILGCVISRGSPSCMEFKPPI